jgi:hypothetical protein
MGLWLFSATMILMTTSAFGFYWIAGLGSPPDRREGHGLPLSNREWSETLV